MTAPPTLRPRTLSKSDFKLARTCDAKLYFRENRYPDNGELDPYLLMLAQGGYMVEALAKASFPDGIQLEYGMDPAADAALTREYLERDHVTLFEGTLLWNRRLARADIIQKDGNTVRLIEIKAKSFDGAEHAALLAAGKQGVFCTDRQPFRVRADWCKYIDDITFQVLLLERILPGATIEPYLLLVDKSKRAGLSDIPRLFEVIRRPDRNGIERLHTARFLGEQSHIPQLDLLTQVDVSREVAMMRHEVEEEADRFESLLDAPLTGFTRVHAAKCKECEFRIADLERNGFRECWGELADAKPHVLDLYSIGKVKSADGSEMVEWLVKSGKASLFDIPESQLRRKDGKIGAEAERQLRQIACTRSGEFWKSADLAHKIANVVYPAHFVDFEVAMLALPYHARMRPYGPVAFQWSSHTVATPGAQLVHGEWLNAKYEWPNERFARTLREQIGDSGSVLTWSKFERTTLRGVIAELGQFGLADPELSAWISDVAERRIVDMNEWAQKHFHHPGMGGRTSIKVVLDALWRSDDEMRTQFEGWTGLTADASRDPYASLPAIEINGIAQDVREGTGAIRAYEAMMYGVEKNDAEAKARWRELLLQYCGLDTLSMVLIFEHLRRTLESRGAGSVR
jgi:hypothetical protein